MPRNRVLVIFAYEKIFVITFYFSPDITALLLRIVFGGLFVYHGYTKLIAYDQILPVFGDLIGLGKRLSFNLVIFAELFCGSFVLTGLLTRLSIWPIFFTMLVAYFIAHAADPFQNKELVFLFMMLCPVVFLMGSGKYSIDHLLLKRKAV